MYIDAYQNYFMLYHHHTRSTLVDGCLNNVRQNMYMCYQSSHPILSDTWLPTCRGSQASQYRNDEHAMRCRPSLGPRLSSHNAGQPFACDKGRQIGDATVPPRPPRPATPVVGWGSLPPTQADLLLWFAYSGRRSRRTVAFCWRLPDRSTTINSSDARLHTVAGSSSRTQRQPALPCADHATQSITPKSPAEKQ